MKRHNTAQADAANGRRAGGGPVGHLAGGAVGRGNRSGGGCGGAGTPAGPGGAAGGRGMSRPETMREPEALPVHDARVLTVGGTTAVIVLDGMAYTLRITRAGKLILTK